MMTMLPRPAAGFARCIALPLALATAAVSAPLAHVQGAVAIRDQWPD